MRQKRLNRHCSTSGVTTGQWSSWCGDTFGKNADSSSCTFLAPRVLLVEASASLALGIANLGLKGIARLLGVAEQHRSVGLVEDRVVDSCVSHTQGTFHHNHLEREETQSRALISLRLDRKAQFSKEKSISSYSWHSLVHEGVCPATLDLELQPGCLLGDLHIQQCCFPLKVLFIQQETWLNDVEV